MLLQDLDIVEMEVDLADDWDEASLQSMVYSEMLNIIILCDVQIMS